MPKVKSIQDLRNLSDKPKKPKKKLNREKYEPGSTENPIDIKKFQGPAGDRLDEVYSRMGVSSSVDPETRKYLGMPENSVSDKPGTSEQRAYFNTLSRSERSSLLDKLVSRRDFDSGLTDSGIVGEAAQQSTGAMMSFNNPEDEQNVNNSYELDTPEGKDRFVQDFLDSSPDSEVEAFDDVSRKNPQIPAFEIVNRRRQMLKLQEMQRIKEMDR